MVKRLILTFALTFVAQAADLSGIWTGQTTDRNGDLQDLSFRLTQTGDTVTGKMYGDNESVPVTDIKIAGDQISFSVTNELNGQVTTFLYTGTIKANEIQMVRNRAGAKPDPAKPNPIQKFTLKRLT